MSYNENTNNQGGKANRMRRMKTNRKPAVSAAVGFILFAAISYFVMTRDVLTFDIVVRELVYGLRSEPLTALMIMITYLGNWQTILLICITLLLFPRTRISYGLPASAAALAASMILRMLKALFHRARPDLALHLITQGGYSYPSGHSFTVLIFYGMLIFLCRRKMKNKNAANLATVLLSCLVLLIGISRIYLGVHYPTDVLGGWSIGLCMLMIMISCILIIAPGGDDAK